jgi:hypothetical protein
VPRTPVIDTTPDLSTSSVGALIDAMKLPIWFLGNGQNGRENMKTTWKHCFKDRFVAYLPYPLLRCVDPMHQLSIIS